MAKTTIDSRGVVSTPGTGVSVKSPVTLQAGQKNTVDAKTAAATLTRGGVYTISGASGALTMTLPDPADVPGAPFTFRCGSADAHLLTSSQVTQDTTTITDGTNVGARLALPNVIGSSVHLVSDGLNYLVLGSSGSYTISTPSA